MNTDLHNKDMEVNGFVKGSFKPPCLRFEDIQSTAEYLRQRTKHRPRIGVICGSGLGGLVDILDATDAFDYKDIPHFPISTVPGHAGRLVFGKLGDATVVCMQGRVHGYEGYPMWKITFPVRVMKELGVEILMATNASGGLNRQYKVGDLMIIKDHINFPGLAGLNPLIGLTDSRLGPRFPPLSKAYDPALIRTAWKVSKELGFDFVQEGVYSMQCGPAFETVAECRMLSMMGADVTGMSTVPEVLTAAHCGMRAFGMSLVTNMCVMEYDSPDEANHVEVLETGKMRAKDTQKFFLKLIQSINQDM